MPGGVRQEVNDGLLQKQFQLLTATLADPAPAVRAAAAGGVGGLLDRYWELMPHATVAAYLQRLCGAPAPVCWPLANYKPFLYLCQPQAIATQ